MGFKIEKREFEKVVKETINISIFTCDWCGEKVEAEGLAHQVEKIPEGWFNLLQHNHKNEKFICPKCYDLRLK